MGKFSKYVGLDTHKETIAVSVANGAGGRARPQVQEIRGMCALSPA